jgi:hypothetical protein
MCGRAGRKGKDEAGETYLICAKADMQAVCDLLDADMPAIESCLGPEKRGLKRYVISLYLLERSAHILKSVVRSNSNGTGVWMRSNSRLCPVHLALSRSGQETCLHYNEIRTSRTSQRRTSYLQRR